MAIDLVPREASGAAIGITGIASYAAAGIQMVVTGMLLDGHMAETGVHDYTYASWFWLGAAVLFVCSVALVKNPSQPNLEYRVSQYDTLGSEFYQFFVNH